MKSSSINIIMILLKFEMQRMLRGRFQLMFRLLFFASSLVIFTLSSSNVDTLSFLGVLILFIGLMPLPSLIYEDLHDGHLDILLSSGTQPWIYLTTKIFLHGMLVIIPTVVGTLISLPFLANHLPQALIVLVVMIVLLPSFSALSVLCATLITGTREGSLLLLGIAMPFFIPMVLIIVSFTDSIWSYKQVLSLGAISAFNVPLCVWLASSWLQENECF